MSPAEAEVWLDFARTLEAAPHGSRGALVSAQAAALGLSLPTTYRRLAAVGWSSDRRPRQDKGRSKLDDALAERVALHVASGVSKRGQCRTPVTEAVRHLQERGELAPDVSTSTVNRRLRALCLDKSAMTAHKSTIQRESQHPNHVAFVDVSVALAWHLKDVDGKRVFVPRSAAELASLYEGKREKLKDLRQVLLRYMWTDHYTGAYFVHYFYEAGENATSMAEFLYRAMAPKAELYAELGGDPEIMRSAWPLRGVPVRIVADQGAPFKSALIQELCSEKHGLGIKIELHAPGSAWASGSVESRHGWWQTAFETLLKHRPAPDLRTLNKWAMETAAERQATIKHTRHGRPPTEAWLDIHDDELTECPRREVFFALAMKGEQTGVLTHNRYLRTEVGHFEIRHPQAYAGQRVVYRFAPFLEAGIRVWHPETREEFAAVPAERREDKAGFYVGTSEILGPVSSHTWDDATNKGAAHAPTRGQRVLAAVKAGTPEASTAVADLFDDMPARLERLQFMERAGSAWVAPTEAPSTQAIIDSVSAREWIFKELGRPPETPEEAAWWKRQIGDGLTRAQLRNLLTEYRTPLSTTPAMPVAVNE